MKTPRRLLLVTATVVLLGAVGYGVWRRGLASDAVRGAAGETMMSVALPDVSRLDTDVQQQLRDSHARLTAVAAAPQSSASARAEAYGTFGTMLLAAEYRHEAEQAFQMAQTLAPGDMRWPYYLAHVYRARQEPARAIAALERVLELAPDDVPSLVWLGELHLARGDPAAAQAALRRALELQPASAAAASRLGRAALAQREYTAAVDYLTRALQLDAQASSAHYSLGMAYRALGDVAKAEAQLREAREGGDDPAPADPLMEHVATLLQGAGAFEARGMDALDARDWNAAVENLRRAVALAPGNAVMRLNFGTALSLNGDAAGAERELLEAVRLDPRLAKAHFALGVLAQDAQRWDDAIARFTTAARHDPSLVDARFALAEALRRTGRFDDAVAQYRAVLALDPAASHARFGQAMALVRGRRFDAARLVLEEAIRVHPDQPGLPHALVRILAAAPDPPVRNGARALALLQPLVTNDPGPAVAETMAMVMAELGRFEEAVQWQERAIGSATAAGQRALALRMQDNLGLYRRRQPCRTPWREDDPVIAVVATRG
jgi:tetratricopeptide (TPR) repeat protein